MRTLGIDLSMRVTGICEIDWEDRTYSSCLLTAPKSDALDRQAEEIGDWILKVKASGGWTAIDAPFGYPKAFVAAIESWHNTGALADADDEDIRRRATDKRARTTEGPQGIKQRRMVDGASVSGHRLHHADRDPLRPNPDEGDGK
ncbi:MAG: hypothetical protein WKF58_08895 [Ilumatobacteraceae bacterium]